MSSDSLEPLDPEDPLDLLVDAYRAETAHRDRDSRVLRARVVTALGARRRAPRALVWLGAAAVLFAGSAALAAGGERTVTRLLALLRPQAAAPAERDRAIRRGRRGTAPTAPIPLPLPPANPVDTSPTVVPLSALPLVEPPAPAKGRPARPSPELPAPRAAADPGPDLGAELSLYQRAHALHFGGGPPAEALDAWRDYLHEHPRGALAAEARLNEAVCLVKLGRRREGRRILEALSTGNAPQSTERQASELLLTLGPESAR